MVGPSALLDQCAHDFLGGHATRTFDQNQIASNDGTSNRVDGLLGGIREHGALALARHRIGNPYCVAANRENVGHLLLRDQTTQRLVLAR